MDSLTQIVLGAAVGEVCLGKKIGNRAMFWGGVAGTIPDLDVMGTSFLSPIQSVTIHRGFSHSILFAVLFSFLISYLVKRYYDSGWYRNKNIRIVASIIGIVGVLAFFAGINAFLFILGMHYFALIFSVVTLVGFAILVSIRLWKNYGKITQVFDINVSYKEWYWFFFWSIFTHPILDSFTVYGTQLFLPFSDYRVGLNNISVADPFYTVPFGALLIAAGFYSRGTRTRTFLAWLSIFISSAYMLFTIGNKFYINSIAEKTIKEEKIISQRYITCPSILNNILWSTTIETDSSYFTGQYSWFDKEKIFHLTEIKKDHDLLGKDFMNHYTIDRLSWFSNGYFNVIKRKDGYLQLNDLRYGLFNTDLSPTNEKNYIFRFKLDRNPQGEIILLDDEGGPPPGSEKDMFPNLWKRVKGI